MSIPLWASALVATLLVQTVSSFSSLAIPLLGPPLMARAGLAPESIGLVSALTSAGICWSLACGGPMLAHHGPVRTLQIGLACMAAGLLLLSQPVGLLGLLGALAVGFGLGPNTPAGSQILIRHAPRRHRTLIFSIKQAGVPLGGALAGLVVAPLVLAQGLGVALGAVIAVTLLTILLAQPFRQRLDREHAPAAAAPERAPAAYVRDLFDQYAPRFDEELTRRLAYRTPQALAALLAAQGVAPAGALDILDLGCGTGLSGLALAPFARRLEGLDLSPRMLAAAARTGCYAALHEADLLDFLPTRAASYDLIAAADVLNYLGDLGPALAAIATALRPGGLAAFSVETGDVSPYALGEGLRYRHALPHLRGLCAAAGLGLLAGQESVLRQERGHDVAGALLLLRRPG
ncbi:MFS transporter [Teichococcus cervicalis]|uniref:Methyltransferase domain protein n=1 Tax=Pseudoroseomonas cervicalis ATCC 49957 TaxID=525371 RepID=D5RTC5_9PROT|nr:MFS transporter [Pseudoroseomonas cervicalis]EFH09444.1 methyltransferase domain protein [Pseudoroseomonas cervicalis ATCC 49957]